MDRDSEPDLESLVKFYTNWRDYDEYGVIQRQIWNGYDVEKKTIAVKCSKRGNDVYQRRVRDRLQVLRLDKGDAEFFTFNDANPKVGIVFVTLTWRAEGNVAESWESIGEHFNRWITNLREKYGRISYERDWEATARGYCHVHALLMFHDSEFLAFKTIDEGGRFLWRVSDKAEFERSWPAFVDVEAVRTYRTVVRYLQKRVVKGTDKSDEDAGDLTMALMWLFRKRSFAISRDLAHKLADLIVTLRKSKHQATLTGGFVEEKWVWLGVFSASELGLTGLEWSSELKIVPTAKKMLGFEH